MKIVITNKRKINMMVAEITLRKYNVLKTRQHIIKPLVTHKSRFQVLIFQEQCIF